MSVATHLTPHSTFNLSTHLTHSTPLPATAPPSPPHFPPSISHPEVTHEPSERNKERASLDLLQKSYNELNSRKIKDPLSSFLPDIPGTALIALPYGLRSLAHLVPVCGMVCM